MTSNRDDCFRGLSTMTREPPATNKRHTANLVPPKEANGQSLVSPVCVCVCLIRSSALKFFSSPAKPQCAFIDVLLGWFRRLFPFFLFFLIFFTESQHLENASRPLCLPSTRRKSAQSRQERHFTANRRNGGNREREAPGESVCIQLPPTTGGLAAFDWRPL